MKTRMEVLEALLQGHTLHSIREDYYYKWEKDSLLFSIDEQRTWLKSQLFINMESENFAIYTSPPKVVAFSFKKGIIPTGDVYFVIEKSERYWQLKNSSDHIEVEVTPDMMLKGLK